MKLLILFSLFAVPIWADSSDVEVLRCEQAGKFTFRLVATDTGIVVSLTEAPGRKASTLRLDSNVKWNFTHQSFQFNSLLFVFDDAKNPTRLKVARPATSALSGQTATCTLKDPKRYSAIFQLGTLAVPGDLVGNLFAGDFVTIRFTDRKHASGDFDCEYRYLGDARANCRWNSRGELVNVQFDHEGKTHTHVFHADPDVQSLISRSATLSR
jgi:hypothetical protein